jgi:phage terminase large subunit-like protein
MTNQIEEAAATLAALSPDELRQFQARNREIWKKQVAERKLYSLFPDTGPLRRELYPKHLSFFAAGGKHEQTVWCGKDCDGTGHQERALIAANRTGKTLAVCYELTCHLIGQYPEWWIGRRFDGPVVAWAAGEDAKAVRESLQVTLIGPPEAEGTGLIPKASITGRSTRQGVADSLDSVTVAHTKGGASRLLFKTYDQGRESFQAAAVDVMLLDEEPPSDIYSESLTRTMSTVPGKPNGIVMCSFTPLKGYSAVVQGYMPNLRAQKDAT